MVNIYGHIQYNKVFKSSLFFVLKNLRFTHLSSEGFSEQFFFYYSIVSTFPLSQYGPLQST